MTHSLVFEWEEKHVGGDCPLVELLVSLYSGNDFISYMYNINV